METGATYLTATQVKGRYGGRSDMWLFRRMRDDENFPKPIKISKRRYWELTALLEWEKTFKTVAEAAA